MKCKPEHFALLKAAIERVLENNPDVVEQYETGKFARSERVKDLQKRFNWDLFYASGIKVGDGIGMSGLPLYAYMNDSHISTALKAICPSVTRRY